MYLGPCETSMMEFLAEVANDLKLLTISTKSPIIYNWQCPTYAFFSGHRQKFDSSRLKKLLQVNSTTDTKHYALSIYLSNSGKNKLR